jgi:hypothetical protein
MEWTGWKTVNECIAFERVTLINNFSLSSIIFLHFSQGRCYLCRQESNLLPPRQPSGCFFRRHLLFGGWLIEAGADTKKKSANILKNEGIHQAHDITYPVELQYPPTPRRAWHCGGKRQYACAKDVSTRRWETTVPWRCMRQFHPRHK